MGPLNDTAGSHGIVCQTLDVDLFVVGPDPDSTCPVGLSLFLLLHRWTKGFRRHHSVPETRCLDRRRVEDRYRQDRKIVRDTQKDSVGYSGGRVNTQREGQTSGRDVRNRQGGGAEVETTVTSRVRDTLNGGGAIIVVLSGAPVMTTPIQDRPETSIPTLESRQTEGHPMDGRHPPTHTPDV